MKSIVQKESLSLIMAFPLILALLPRPNLPGAQYLSYPGIAFLLMCLGIIYLNEIKFNKRFTLFTSMLFAYAFSLSLSAAFNAGDISSTAVVHLFKPVLFLIILCFGYIIGTKYDIGRIKAGLLKSAYTILAFQVMVGITQLFDISLFGWIYSDFKTRPLGAIVRIAGTMGNPNIFAWIVTQMCAIVFLFETKSRKKWLAILIGISLVFLSGSRSLFILFPAVIVALKFLCNKRDWKLYIFKTPLYLLLLGACLYFGYQLLLKYGSQFPYIYQLISILEPGSLQNVSSFAARTIMWQDALFKFHEQEGFLTWLFGLGPGAIEVLDNDYLYGLVNYGLLAMAINILMYVTFFFSLSKLENREWSALGKQYIIFSFIISYQADTLNGWNYPMFIMFYMGITAALYKQKKSYSTY